MATANFTFTTLTGTETAGWNSINSLITSIDTQLNASNRLIYMSGWSAVAGQTIKWDAANSRWVPGTLDAAALANNSVTEAKIATDAVTSGKIAADAVGSSEIAAGAVTLAKISPTGSSAGQVLTSTGSGSDPSWQNASIGNSNIADNAITQAKLADNSVGTAEIIDANVTYSKLAADAKYLTAVSVVTSGASARTFGLSDADNKMIEYNSASAGTFTVPADATTNFPIGSQINVLQVNTGQLTIAGATSPNTVTVNATPGLKLRAQWSSATLIKRAANTWVLIGDITA